MVKTREREKMVRARKRRRKRGGERVREGEREREEEGTPHSWRGTRTSRCFALCNRTLLCGVGGVWFVCVIHIVRGRGRG